MVRMMSRYHAGSIPNGVIKKYSIPFLPPRLKEKPSMEHFDWIDKDVDETLFKIVILAQETLKAIERKLDIAGTPDADKWSTEGQRKLQGIIDQYTKKETEE